MNQSVLKNLIYQKLNKMDALRYLKKKKMATIKHTD